MVTQVNSNFAVRDKGIVTNLKQVMNLLPSFEKLKVAHISH